MDWINAIIYILIIACLIGLITVIYDITIFGLVQDMFNALMKG